MFGPALIVKVLCSYRLLGLTVCSGATTGGVKMLVPLGLGFFSVGVSEASVVVVVVVDVSGAFSLSLLHAAVKPIIARMAAPPTAAEIRRPRRFDAMFGPLLEFSLW